MKRLNGLRQAFLLIRVIVSGRYEVTDLSFGRIGFYENQHPQDIEDGYIYQAFQFVGKVKKTRRIKHRSFWGNKLKHR